MSYLALIVLTLIIGVGAQAWVNHALKKYSRVPIASNKTGAQAAREMLNFYGIDIPINMGAEGQDFFDPRTNSITLSPSAYGQASITALATACHECGHACQYAQKYAPMSIRSALVPAVNLCSNVWVVVLFLGIALNVAGLTWAAIGLYAVSVLFALVTLPVEFNASNRAIAYMQTIGLSKQEICGSKSVLRACAFTYVAAMLASLLQLIYLLGMRRD